MLTDAIPFLNVAIAGTQVLVAASLFALTFRIHRWEKRRHREMTRREEELKEREARLTKDIHSNEIKLQRLLKFREWGNECIDALAQADHFFVLKAGKDTPIEGKKLRSRLLEELSSLIDRGRVFIKNENTNCYGGHKLPAYRGLRPKILDPMVAAYCAVDVLGDHSKGVDVETSKRLFEWRKYFVSLLQREVGEEWTTMDAISGYSDSRNSDLSGGGAGNSINEHSVAPSDI